MPYIEIRPDYLERYYTGRSVYLGPTTPIRYGVMSTRVDPDTGEIMLTGYREEHGLFPVLPGFFLFWIFKGIWNWIVGKILSIFGIKPEENPLRLDFHIGYLDRGYMPSRDFGNGYGNSHYKSGFNYRNGSYSSLNNKVQELYRFD
ncbi:MAG: hypothetical protein QXN96_04165 [Candidatus Bathyarchaeia archaeon]